MSERTDVLEALRKAADHILGDEAPVLEEDVILSDENIDSLDFIEMMMLVEDTYDIVLEGEDLQGLKTVGALIDLILSKRVPVDG